MLSAVAAINKDSWRRIVRGLCRKIRSAFTEGEKTEIWKLRGNELVTRNTKNSEYGGPKEGRTRLLLGTELTECQGIWI